MKKLLLVPVIGVLSASGVAFAAGLNVQPGAPVQVGVTSSLKCADSVQVTEWGYDDRFGGVVANAEVVVNDPNNDCTGRLYVSPLNADGAKLANLAGGDSLGSIGINGGGSYRVHFSTAGPAAPGPVETSGVRASALEGVQIAIDQGYGADLTTP